MIISSSADIEISGFQKLLMNHRVKNKSKTVPFTSAVIIKLAGTSQLLDQTIKSLKILDQLYILREVKWYMFKTIFTLILWQYYHKRLTL